MQPANVARKHRRNELLERRHLAGNGLAALFPELIGDRRRLAGLCEGLLRVPPRAGAAPPCISAVVGDAGGAQASGGIKTPNELLASAGWEDPALLARASAARRELCAAQVGGAWWHHGPDPRQPPGGHALVVLAEPRLADDACVPASALAAMLDAALVQHAPERLVIVAPAAAGPLASRRAAAAAAGAILVGPAVDPWTVLGDAVRVYGSGGETGFLALLAGVPVAAFHGGFYTGWGITDDAPGVPKRALKRTVDEVFAGACLLATRCRDPYRGTPATFEEIVAILADWRRAEEANRRIAVCVGMSFWKRRRIREFVRSTGGTPVFRRTAEGALAAVSDNDGAIAGWASRLPDGLAEKAARRGVPLIRVEDGFVRSVGLGSDFLPPASLVFDSRGMYYDPRAESDLEVLLREAEFAPALIERADRLTARLIDRGVTKYNLADRGPPRAVPAGIRRILVPGQVEDDLSIVYGAARVRRNLDLLAAVRSANRDAFILYKPHPDVIAGHRKGAVPEAEVRHFADAIVAERSTAALLAQVDELHTMTSLAGFEALLRGRRVVVYGRPFYSGWGLTVDRLPFDRGRRLSLEELVAGVLILYPRYLDPLTRLPCGPEVVIDRLDDPELWRPGPLVLARRLQGLVARRFAELRALAPTAAPGVGRGLKERLRL